MPNEEIKQNPWLFFADNDLALAELAIDNIQFTGQVAFLCQQAIEKYLKAFLFENKVQIKKIHDLEKLYSEVRKIKDFGINENLLQILRNLYVESRYPADIAFLESGVLPTKEDAQSYLDFAKEIASIIKEEIK
jgi:HEPN domain-containing protein